MVVSFETVVQQGRLSSSVCFYSHYSHRRHRNECYETLYVFHMCLKLILNHLETFTYCRTLIYYYYYYYYYWFFLLQNFCCYNTNKW